MKIRKIFLKLIMALIVLACVIPAWDCFAGDEQVSIEFVNIYDSTSTWSFPYSDELFLHDPDVYDHTFARCSMGLTVAAFRNKTINMGNYDNIEKYFNDIGFGNVSADMFLEESTVDSVTYAIASKKIGTETVIAVVCCGAGYGKEWAGNLTIGTGVRHQGFDSAARTVEDAICGYIEQYDISGDKVLWTSGFSRAAAVANVVAADETDGDIFTRVYAYTFATPRTTKEPGNYTNIFNIVGKDDPVPMIPFADWGFQRYGVDCYIRSAESDGDYYSTQAQASEILEELSGREYMVNPEMNSHIRTFFDYLYELIPTEEKYVSALQPGVLKVLGGMDGDDAIHELIIDIVKTFTPQNEKEEEELGNLLDYVQQLVNIYLLQGNAGQIAAGAWDTRMDLVHNLTAEHDPNRYISWLFSSDDPEDIFSEGTTYQMLFINGEMDIDIYDEEGYVQTIHPDGEITFENAAEGMRSSSHLLECSVTEGVTEVLVPGDGRYLVMAESLKDQEVTYYSIGHSNESVRSDISVLYTANVKEGSMLPLYFEAGVMDWEDGLEGYTEREAAVLSSLSYSPSVIMRLQQKNVLHITIDEIIGGAFIIAVILGAEFLICVVLGIIRLIKKRTRHTVPTIVLRIFNAFLFLFVDVTLWYFAPAYPIASTAARAVEFLFLLTLALIGLKYNKNRRNLIICISLFALMAVAVATGPALITRITDASAIVRLA